MDNPLKQENVRLVLVFHGAEDVGWESLTEVDLKEYYSYITGRSDDLWVAAFRDITQYTGDPVGKVYFNYHTACFAGRYGT